MISRALRFLLLSIPLIVGGALAGVAIMIGIQSTRDEARAADAIVVLGAAEYRGRPSPVLRLRLDHALALYRRRIAPRLIATGGVGTNARFTEAETARDYLVEHGVPAEAILIETEGTSTVQSLTAVAEISGRHALRSVVVVSDGYHIFRAKRILESHGIAAYGSPRPNEETGRWRRLWLYMRQSAAYWLWLLRLSR